MHRLTATTPVLAAAALLSGSAFAHHSMSMFDMSKVEVIEGKVARLEWTNPHMYLAIETKGPDGKPALVEGEGLGITQALVDGLKREALNARHSGRRPRQSESQRLGQAGAHPRRHDSRRRDSSVLCGQHAHASVDASGEHRGTLGAEPRLDRCRVRGDGGFPAERRRKGRSGEATLATVSATSSRPRSAPYSTSCVRSTSARTKS